MRRRSGSGKKFLALWVAALLAVGMIGAAALPAGAQTQSSPVAGQAESSLVAGQAASSAALSGDYAWSKAVFEALGKGAVGALGNVAVGYALDAMGLSAKSTDELEALKSINNSLLKIIDQLNGIQMELQQLNATLQQLNCDWLSANLNEWLARIDSLASTYQAFNDVAIGKYGTPTVPPLESMTTWADQVTNDLTGIPPALHAISNALMPAGSAQGIITACLQPGVIHRPANDTFGDVAYYDQVANLIDFYYAYQVRGLLLLQEAYHFQAQQASAQTPPPTSPGEICDEEKATDPVVLLACTRANNYTNLTYERLARQFALGGLPYTDDNVIIQNTGGPNPPLYPRSLEKFTEAAGDHCPTPLTSAHPCGVTVASGRVVDSKPDAVVQPMDVDYDGYSEWWPAGSYHLSEMIKNRGNMTPAKFLDENGFANAGNKILLIPQKVHIRLKTNGESLYNRETAFWARCFLDTGASFGVACSQSTFMNHVLGSAPRYGCNGKKLYTWASRESLPKNRNDFYEGWYRPNRNSVPIRGTCVYHFDPLPGWAYEQSTQEPNQRQFRWPKLQVGGDLTCTGGRLPTNPGGMPTRCGHNFDTLFDTLVPRPEICLGTRFAQCERVEVETTRAAVSHHRVSVKLYCTRVVSGAACTGTLSLTEPVWRLVRRRIQGHRVTYPVLRETTIGRRSYRLAGGKSSALSVRITSGGERMLEASAHHRLRVRVSATVSGGGGGHRQVVVSSS